MLPGVRPVQAGAEGEHEAGQGEHGGQFDDGAEQDGDQDEGVAGESDGGDADDGFGVACGGGEYQGGGVGVAEPEPAADSEAEQEEPGEEDDGGGDINPMRARPRPPKLGWNAKIATISAASAHSLTSPIACL